MVKTFNDRYVGFCRPTFRNNRVNYMLIGKHFMSRLRITPNLMVMDMVRLAKEELFVEVAHT